MELKPAKNLIGKKPVPLGDKSQPRLWVDCFGSGKWGSVCPAVPTETRGPSFKDPKHSSEARSMLGNFLKALRGDVESV